MPSGPLPEIRLFVGVIGRENEFLRRRLSRFGAILRWSGQAGTAWNNGTRCISGSALFGAGSERIERTG